MGIIPIAAIGISAVAAYFGSRLVKSMFVDGMIPESDSIPLLTWAMKSVLGVVAGVALFIPTYAFARGPIENGLRRFGNWVTGGNAITDPAERGEVQLAVLQAPATQELAASVRSQVAAAVVDGDISQGCAKYAKDCTAEDALALERLGLMAIPGAREAGGKILVQPGPSLNT